MGRVTRLLPHLREKGARSQPHVFRSSQRHAGARLDPPACVPFRVGVFPIPKLAGSQKVVGTAQAVRGCGGSATLKLSFGLQEPRQGQSQFELVEGPEGSPSWSWGVILRPTI